jgi:hypothetical protein
LGRKCIDFAPPASQRAGGNVYLWDCNGTPAQDVRTVEIDAETHDVRLMSSAGLCVGVRGGALIGGAGLELQACSSVATQRFAFDGDALYTGLGRAFVVETLGGRGADWTPLVLGTQETDAAEVFTFVPRSSSTPYPHTGFVTPHDEGQLRAAVNRGWGTVVVLDEVNPITVTSTIRLEVAGTTVRGFRRGMWPGARVNAPVNAGLFDAAAERLRFTGFRCHGPNRTKVYTEEHYSSCINAAEGRRVLVDHLEAESFPWAALNALGDQFGVQCTFTQPRNPSIRFLRNYIHHGQMERNGYGVQSGSAFPLVEGNTFTQNRHAIAGTWHASTGYQAIYNLVTSASEEYPGVVLPYRNQDFDMHGGSPGDGDGYGERGGDYVDIGYNTFLSTDGRKALHYRGAPCRQIQIHHNVNLNSINNFDLSGIPDPQLVNKWANQEPGTNPWQDLAVGDFDGDGRDDLFMGTGAAWYYAPQGATEWRFLNRASERASALRFGDFDRDGRTDVLAYHGGAWDVSWGGASPWERINTLPVSFADLRVGDFDGDGIADVFMANGREWFISRSGRGAWTHFALAIHRARDLLFADFNRDGKTDVFGIDGGWWKYVPGGSDTWVWLRQAPAGTSLAQLRVGDFDGDGYADVARGASGTWELSPRGTGALQRLWSAVPGGFSSATHLGRFSGGTRVEMLKWLDDRKLGRAWQGAVGLQPWTHPDVHAH